MTTHAMPATPLAASLPSISPRPAVALDGGDVFVTVTFRPCSPSAPRRSQPPPTPGRYRPAYPP